jgi:hypothetical protein
MGHALKLLLKPFDRDERSQRSIKDWIACASNTLHYLSYYYTIPISFTTAMLLWYLLVAQGDRVRRSSWYHSNTTPDKPKKRAVVGLIEIVTTILLTR